MPAIRASRFMAVYLRLIAALYFFGGAVHVANILGFGQVPFSEAPLAWQIGDVYFGTLDIVAVIGLILIRWWGLAAFLLAAFSQLVAYTLFADAFAFNDEQSEALTSMLWFHAVTLAIFFGGLYAVARNANNTTEPPSQ